MAKALGSVAVLQVGTDGVTYTSIGKIKSISEPHTFNMVDATDNDSGGTKEKLVGDSEFKLSVTCNYDSADAAQTTIVADAPTKTLLYFRYRPKGTNTGEIQYVGTGYISKLQIDAKHEVTEELMFDVEFTAGVTKSTQ